MNHHNRLYSLPKNDASTIKQNVRHILHYS